MVRSFLDSLAEGLSIGREAIVKYGKLGAAVLASERVKNEIHDVEARLGRLARERLSTKGELRAEDGDAKKLLKEIAAKSEELREIAAAIRELREGRPS